MKNDPKVVSVFYLNLETSRGNNCYKGTSDRFGMNALKERLGGLRPSVNMSSLYLIWFQRRSDNIIHKEH